MKTASWIRFSTWIACLCLALSAPLAAQAFEISLVGGADLSKPSVQLNGASVSGVSFKTAFGGGLLAGFDLGPMSELELGTLYMNRKYTYPVGSGTGEDSYAHYEIPVILRYTGFHVLTFGVGGYYAIPVGTYTYTQTASDGSSSSTNSNASDQFKNDYGVVGSLAIKIPFNEWTSLVFDGRYEYGLVNTTKTAGESFKTRDIEALAGFALGF